ncbi:MAG: DUF2975 domain-containing protein [Pseudomonadota bacterium]
MSRKLSAVISWVCLVILVLVPIFGMGYLIRIESFAAFVQGSIGLPIQWSTVSNAQWYGLWVITAVFVSIGLVGLYFLRRAFVNFAKGEFFNTSNSRDIRRFSILLLAQALATPLHITLSSLLLSANHPAGQKMLSIAFGSNELKAIGVALVLWVLSDLLVQACHLDAENKQFV